MKRRMFITYKSSSKTRRIQRDHYAPNPVEVGVIVSTGSIDVTVMLTVYKDGSYELSSGGRIKYVGAVN